MSAARGKVTPGRRRANGPARPASLDAVARGTLARLDALRADRFAVDAVLAREIARRYGPHVCP